MRERSFGRDDPPAGTIDVGVGRGTRSAGEIDPALRKDTLAVPHTIAQVEIAELRKIPRAGPDERAAKIGSFRVELGDRVHADPVKQDPVKGGLGVFRVPLRAERDLQGMPDIMKGGCGIGPERARRMHEGEGAHREAERIEPSIAVHQLDHIAFDRVRIAIEFVVIHAVDCVEPLAPGDGGRLAARGMECGHGGIEFDVRAGLLGRAHERLRDRFGHAPGNLPGLRREALGVGFGHEPAAPDNDEPARFAHHVFD